MTAEKGRVLMMLLHSPSKPGAFRGLRETNKHLYDLKRASESLVAANLSVLGGPITLSVCVPNSLQHFSAVLARTLLQGPTRTDSRDVTIPYATDPFLCLTPSQSL